MSSIALTGTDIDIDTKYVCHLIYILYVCHLTYILYGAHVCHIDTKYVCHLTYK